MEIFKITVGFVIQQFDTELGKYISQEFIAGDEVSYEFLNGEIADSSLMEINGVEPYLPLEMSQPS